MFRVELVWIAQEGKGLRGVTVNFISEKFSVTILSPTTRQNALNMAMHACMRWL